MRISKENRLNRLRASMIKSFGFDSITKNTIFIDNKTPIEGYCGKHNMIFENKIKDIYRGMGCVLCYRDRQKFKSLKTTGMFIEDAKRIHGENYDYSNVDYKDCRIEVEIICKIHKSFWQKPKYHLEGKGCKKCGSVSKCVKENSFGRSKFRKLVERNEGKGTLYIIECFNDTERFYKVGITGNSTKVRFHGKRNMPYRYKILKEIKGDADFILNMERALHVRLGDYHYIPSIGFSGHKTECFSRIGSLLNEY